MQYQDELVLISYKLTEQCFRAQQVSVCNAEKRYWQYLLVVM